MTCCCYGHPRSPPDALGRSVHTMQQNGPVHVFTAVLCALFTPALGTRYGDCNSPSQPVNLACIQFPLGFSTPQCHSSSALHSGRAVRKLSPKVHIMMGNSTVHTLSRQCDAHNTILLLRVMLPLSSSRSSDNWPPVAPEHASCTCQWVCRSGARNL